MAALAEWLGAWPGAVLLQRSGTAYLLVNAGHVLGLGLLLGAILPLDLRLVLGRQTALLPLIAPVLIRTAASGLALALATGLWLFSVKPSDYLGNAAFVAKIALLAAALANIALQHRWLGEALAATTMPLKVRLLAGVSAALWLSVLVAGRWIGFL